MPAKKRKNVTIYSSFPDEIEKSIIKQCCRIDLMDSDVVHISEFKRYGFSGARLRLIFFNRRQRGTPYLLKIAKLNDITDEIERMKKIKCFVTDCDLMMTEPLYHRSWGGLLLKHQGTAQGKYANNTVSFKDILFTQNTFFDNVKLQQCINEVFDKLNEFHEEELR